MPAQNLDKHSLKILTMEPSGLVTNNSHQELMSDCDSVDVTGGVAGNSMNSDKIETERGLRDVTLKEWITVVILCFVNLINYMDRFTLAGILADIQKHFDIGDDKGGLLQTAFVLSYMIFAPLFGYLGDRYSRRAIMAFGVFLWSLTTLLGSYMDNFVLFIIFRAFVGIGEASYSTIAPTIISDLFVKNVRSKMLALFYFAIPVGSGLGYIVGAETARIAGHWQWGLRVTPFLGAVAVILIIIFMQEPERGQAEGNTHIHTTSWFEDITDLCKNRSFIFSTAGFTCVAFVAGALAWWGPTFIHLGMKLQPGNEDVTLNDVAYKFGLLAMLAGIIGVPSGSLIAQKLRNSYANIDPMICATGLLISAPLVFFSLVTVSVSTTGCFFLMFFAELTLNLTWSIVADMLLYVVIPTRRSTGEAFQILISHALGDAGSPYLIGVISEALKIVLTSSINHNSLNNFTNSESSSVMSMAHNLNSDDEVKFKSLQYALFTTCFVEVIGGFFFLLTALYIVNDKLLVDRTIAEQNQPRNLYAEDTSSDLEQRRNLVT